MKTLLPLFCIFFAVCASNNNVYPSDPRLLINRNMFGSFAIEGMDFAIKYSLYNVGSGMAKDVIMKDDNFDENLFEAVSSGSKVTFHSIQAGGNVTHIVLYKPKMNGLFRIKHAEVLYKNIAGDQMINLTTTDMELLVYEPRYKKKLSGNLDEWISFIVISLPSILIPYLLWYKSKSKYEIIPKNFKKY